MNAPISRVLSPFPVAYALATRHLPGTPPQSSFFHFVVSFEVERKDLDSDTKTSRVDQVLDSQLQLGTVFRKWSVSTKI